MNQNLLANITVAVGLVATVAFGLAFRQTPETNSGVKKTILRSSVSAPIETLDSNTYGSVGASDAIGTSNVGLYTLDSKGKAVPAISDGHPQVSANHLRYTFTLRDYHWSDGSPVTAADFVYAWRRLASPQLNARNASRVDMFANGYAVRTGAKPLSALGVRALSDHKLQIDLSTTTPYVSELLARTSMLPIKHNFASKLGKSYGDSSAHALADGPFVVKGWSGPNDMSWTYVKNPDYYRRGRVHLDRVSIRVLTDPTVAAKLYHQGKIDYAAIDSQQLKSYTGNRNLHFSRTTTAAYLFFNTQSGVTTNVHLRRALATAYDKQLLVRGTLGDGAQVLNGLVPSDLATSLQGVDYRRDTGQLLRYNPNYANNQWQIARKQLQINKVRIPLLIANNNTAELTATFLKGQIEHNLPGISIKIEKATLAQRMQREEQGKFRIVFSTWTPADGDPYEVLTFDQSNSLQNVSGFSNARYDQMLDAISTQYGMEPTKRWRATQAAERLIMNDYAPTAGVFQDGTAYLLAPRVRRFPVLPSGTIDYADARIY